MKDIAYNKETLPVELQTDDQVKALILFLVKEIYGSFAFDANLIKDVDGMWILFLPSRKTTLYYETSLKKMYDVLMEEYEGYILYSTATSEYSQFKNIFNNSLN